MKGEFEKRIKVEIEHAKQSLRADLEEFGIVGAGFWENHEEVLLKIVEEVRKEFPRLIPQIPMSMVTVNDYIHRELEPWFEKWLAEEPEKE